MRANRCDCCGEKFGLVSHNRWNRRFCSRFCRRIYQAEHSRIEPWIVAVAGHAGRAIDWSMSMMQHRNWASQAENSGS
jgi:hypothetical protein